MDDAQIAYDERGLVPCVVQDWRTGEVLTLAYMNAEALERTRDTGEMHFFSRSRQELWHKGETSGNTQALKALRYDCDADALLALVEPAGPACHTGERTCFYRGDLEPAAPAEALPDARAHARRARRRAPRGLLHRRRCSTTRRSSARRSRRRPRRSPAPRARRPTTASPRRPPTCSTTSPCCCTRATSRCPTRWRCSMAVAADLEAPPVSPSLEEARELARDHNLIPLRHTFIEDCETPVSAFLKLREGGPGVPARVRRAGRSASGASRSSASGRARSCAGRSRDGGDPYAIAAAEVGRYRQAPLDGPAAVRGRRGGLLRLRPRAHRRAARRAQPRPARAAGHGADALRRARGLRPPQAHGHRARQRLRRRRRARRRLRRRAWTRSPRCARRLAGPVPRAAATPGRAGARPSSPT